MKTLSTTDSSLDVRKLVEAVSKEPVMVLDNGAPAAVAVSPAEFARLEARDRVQREARQRLRATVVAMREEASARGLTDDELERLLADES